jgi:hypothetical protein
MNCFSLFDFLYNSIPEWRTDIVDSLSKWLILLPEDSQHAVWLTMDNQIETVQLLLSMGYTARPLFGMSVIVNLSKQECQKLMKDLTTPDVIRNLFGSESYAIA